MTDSRFCSSLKYARERSFGRPLKVAIRLLVFRLNECGFAMVKFPGKRNHALGAITGSVQRNRVIRRHIHSRGCREVDQRMTACSVIRISGSWSSDPRTLPGSNPWGIRLWRSKAFHPARRAGFRSLLGLFPR